MEKIQSIDEYIAAEMAGQIVRKRNSPASGLLLLAVGIGLLVLMHRTHLSDSLSAGALTVGLVCLAVGLVLTAMNFTGAMAHYLYKPTGKSLKSRTVCLEADDYRRCFEAIGAADAKALAALRPAGSTNSAVHVMHSTDWAVALLQAGRDDTGHFEAETQVLCLTGTEAALICKLCK